MQQLKQENLFSPRWGSCSDLISESGYHCYFLEHTFYPAREIGKLYSINLKDYNVSSNKSTSVILSTCQRIEIYTLENLNPLKYLGLPFLHISGKKNITKRLTAISAGLRSQILAEKNIFKQVKVSCERIDDHNPFKSIFLKAIDEANTYRTNYNFQSVHEYEDLAIIILNTGYLPLIEEKRKDLVIIGGGMLAQGFLGNTLLSRFYRQIHFVTRSPKSLKKKFRKNNSYPSCSINLYTINTIESINNNLCEMFDCILATTNLNSQYQSKIYKLLRNNKCHGIFDLSAVPVLEDELLKQASYANTYSNNYRAVVEQQNQVLKEKARNITFEIEKLYEYNHF